MNVRLTKGAQDALKYSYDRSTGHIDISELLRRIVLDEDSIACTALDSLGVDIEELSEDLLTIREYDKEQRENGEGAENAADSHFTQAQRIMREALHEARELGLDYIGTEHILLGILRDDKTPAADVLIEYGVDLEKAREAVQMAMADESYFAEGEDDESDRDIADDNSGHKRKHGEGNDRKKRKTPFINRYGRVLNDLATAGRIDPVIGREREIQRVIQILSRRTKNNPILIGEPGVGKTAIAEGLAAKIAEGEVPYMISGKKIVSLNMASVVAGTKYRGEFEERLKNLIDEAKNSADIILFIDEIHTLIGTGGAEGSMDAANILKPALSRGEIQVIGATTPREFKKYLDKDAALERRFQTVNVEEPDEKEAIDILKGLRPKYEEFHHAAIGDAAIEAAVKLSKRYITERFLPDKAIDLMDEASSKVRLKKAVQPEDIKKLKDSLANFATEKKAAIASQDFETAARLRDMEGLVKEKLAQVKKNSQKSGQEKIAVTADDIAEVAALWTGIPVQEIAATESKRLLNLEKILTERVVGQRAAVSAVAKAIRRARTGLKEPNRPIGSFLFLGSTGVGKTELAKALAAALFGTEEAIVRFDMSEYMEKFTVSRLIGAPPGYVGFEEGGMMTDLVRRKPYSVILLDEVEKAHPDVFNLLLQVMEDGRLTDSQGRTIDFKNTVVIMTSNLGSALLRPDDNKLGFALNNGTKEERAKDIKNKVLGEAKKNFRPEFLNRIDEVIVFDPLGREEISAIIDIQLENLQKRLKEKKLSIELCPSAREKLIERGSDFQNGARPLKRAIQKLIENPLAEELLSGHFAAGDTIIIDAHKDKGKLIFRKKITPTIEQSNADILTENKEAILAGMAKDGAIEA